MDVTQVQVKPRVVPREFGPQTSLLIERLENGKPGDTVSYAELSKLCGRDVSFGVGAGNQRSARRFLERSKGLVWEVVRGEQRLQCLNASETLVSARQKRTGIRRHITRLGRRVNAADQDQLNESERKEHAQLVTAVAVLGALASHRAIKRLPEANGMARAIDPQRLIEAISSTE